MGWLSVGVLAASIFYLGFSFFRRQWRTTDQNPANVHSTETRQSGDVQSRTSTLLDAPVFVYPDDPGSDAEAEAGGASPSTPKAGRDINGTLPAVPTFNLDTHDDTISMNGKPSESTKSPPKLSGPAPSPSAVDRNAKAPGLMPPPAVKASALRPLPSVGSSLNPPPSAASRLRGPPGASLQPNLGVSAPSTSTLPPSQRPSRKVVLEPGHSPLDWAMLTRNPPTPTFLRGADIPPQLIKVPPSELKQRNGRKGRDAWGTWQGKVYNLTPYVKFHPGGVGEIMRGAGKPGESERLFNEIHPWVNWDNMLGECLVGILVSEPETTAENVMENID